MSREFKNSGVDWIGEIPVQWELVPTKRIFKGKKKIVGDESDNYERLALTLNGVIKRNKDDNEGLQPEQFNGYQVLEQNELVFKLIDLQNIKTSRVGLSPYTGIVSPAYIILSNSEVDNRFYYYWFTDMYNRCIFNQMGDDGVRSALNVKDLLSIPIPHIAETIRNNIANFLDKKCSEIDEMVVLQEKIIEELKAYKQSVITEAVTKGLNPDVPMKDSGIEWIDSIPNHWVVRKMKSIIDLKSGSNLTSEQISDKDEGYPVYGGNGLRGTFVDYSNEGDYVLVGRQGALCGNINYASGKFWVTEHALVCYPKENIVLKWLGESLRTMNLNQYSISAAQPGLSAERIKNLYMVVPPLSEQQEIADYLDKKCSEIDSLISIKQSKIESLKEYKKSIIYEYVTGKKEVI
ncbi:MAG: restriction endonuclease subunit S [Bacteroidales bacterium]|nr:restriction endonuclease subunit S [Bacteroidales bacterium]